VRYFVGQYFFPQRGSRFEALQDVRLEEDHSGSTEPVERRPIPGDFDDVESLLAVCAESVGEEVEEEAGVFAILERRSSSSRRRWTRTGVMPARNSRVW